jgi:hypothetical protein
LRDVPALNGRTAEIEVYHHGRYFDLTGVRLDGMPAIIESRQAELHELWERHFGTGPVGDTIHNLAAHAGVLAFRMPRHPCRPRELAV